MKALALVRRALALGGEFTSGRRARGLVRSDALFVRAVDLTTLVTRRLGATVESRGETMSVAERATLVVAAAQLRNLGGVLAGDALRTGALPGPKTPEGALLGLVTETLALVERLLATGPALGRTAAGVLPTVGGGEVDGVEVNDEGWTGAVGSSVRKP